MSYWVVLWEDHSWNRRITHAQLACCNWCRFHFVCWWQCAMANATRHPTTCRTWYDLRVWINAMNITCIQDIQGLWHYSCFVDVLFYRSIYFSSCQTSLGALETETSENIIDTADFSDGAFPPFARFWWCLQMLWIGNRKNLDVQLHSQLSPLFFTCEWLSGSLQWISM